MDPLNGRDYKKHIEEYNLETTSESYELNMTSPYVLKAKPYAENSKGMEPMKVNGIQRRLNKLAEVTGFSLSGTDLFRSGIMDMMKEKEDETGESWTCASVGKFLKENNLKGQSYEIYRTYKSKYANLIDSNSVDNINEYDEEFEEGNEKLITHTMRERNPKVIKEAKTRYKKKKGKLICQICKFDFEYRYGEIGVDYIEGHHIIPISELREGAKTKVEDIALVCSNCHSMLHKGNKWLRVDELKKLVKKSNESKELVKKLDF